MIYIIFCKTYLSMWIPEIKIPSCQLKKLQKWHRKEITVTKYMLETWRKTSYHSNIFHLYIMIYTYCLYHGDSSLFIIIDIMSIISIIMYRDKIIELSIAKCFYYNNMCFFFVFFFNYRCLLTEFWYYSLVQL